ncbi:MAG: FAD:protein FMN transferase [Pirellulaceae bacterium]|nr:MAG: FAD:protein FMN transferase [Pirellulaceae bacterium]
MKQLQQTIAACAAFMLVLCAELAIGLLSAQEAAQLFEASQSLMGTQVRILAYADDRERFDQATRAAFDRIAELDSILSDYRSDSEVMRLCATAPHNEPVAVSDDLFEVLRLSQQISEASGGAFDVTVGNLSRLWRRARRQRARPPADLLEAARATVDYRQIELDEHNRRVKLTRPGVRIDFGGIAKGYAAEQALRVLERHGLKSALIDAGGDLVIGEPPPGEPGWKVAIAALERDQLPTERFHAARCAIATSGDLWQYIQIEGRRYSHLLDPRTGWGVEGPRSATVVARNGAVADALATAVSVLPPEQGLRLVEQFHAVMLYMYREGDHVRSVRSPGFPHLPATR